MKEKMKKMAGYKWINGESYQFSGCWPIKMKVSAQDSLYEREIKKNGLTEKQAKDRAGLEAKLLRSAGYSVRVLKEKSGERFSTGGQREFYFCYKRKK